MKPSMYTKHIDINYILPKIDWDFYLLIVEK